MFIFILIVYKYTSQNVHDNLLFWVGCLMMMAPPTSLEIITMQEPFITRNRETLKTHTDSTPKCISDFTLVAMAPRE